MDISIENQELWLAARKLGSSDAAAICGLNPWRSPHAVWLEKTARSAPKEESEPMFWGKIFEPAIAQGFAIRSGMTIEKNSFMAVHPDYAWMTATVDYWVWDLLNEKGILEIKNVNAFSSDYSDGETADYTMVQVMHQMAVTGAQWAIVAAVLGGNKLVWNRIERDEAFISQLIEVERNFWAQVENDTPPPLQGADNDWLSEQFPASNGQTVTLDGRAEVLARAFLNTKREIKNLESKADEYQAQLKQILGSYESGTAGKFRVSWKNYNKKSYVVQASQYRKFDVKEIKNG